MRVVRFFLRLLLLIGILLLVLSALAVFMVSGDTKLAGLLFVAGGITGFLQYGGVVRHGLARESTGSLLLGSGGAIALGIYLILR